MTPQQKIMLAILFGEQVQFDANRLKIVWNQGWLRLTNEGLRQLGSSHVGTCYGIYNEGEERHLMDIRYF